MKAAVDFRCYDCGKEIERNDEAGVCIECGGLNRISKVTPICLRPMHTRPKEGERLTVLMRDGKKLSNCIATMIVSDKYVGIVIYHNRNSIDESNARGWWPA